MSLFSDLSVARGIGFDGRLEADSQSPARVSARTLQTAAAVATVPMIVTTIWLALTSDHLTWPLASGLYRSGLTAITIGVGLYWWTRRPASRFGPLLVALGIGTWVVSWQFSNAPLLFDLGVVAEGPLFVLLFFLFLAFPMGRVDPPAARWLMVALAVVVSVFYALWALFSPAIYGVAPLTSCLPDCPPNVLQIGSADKAIEVVGKVESYTVLAIIAAVFAIYMMRLRAATRPRRRALTAVAVTSMPYLLAAFALTLSSVILQLGPSTLRTEAWIAVGTRMLVPLGFLFALVQAELFAAGALRSLLERLADRPSPEQWHASVAAALDDSALELGYRDPSTGAFLTPDGTGLTPPAGQGRAWVPIDRAGQPVAAMVIDETLAEDPELVRAAATATLVAVENGALEGELRASRARTLEAGDEERQRIRRDLHDSAQQRLLALRIHLMLAGEQAESPRDRALLERFEVEIEQALDELRTVADGGVPRSLTEAGPAAALREAATHAAIPVTVSVYGLTRHPEPVESTIYFCCLECLQNAAKHAGRDASVAIDLDQRDGQVRFTVEDDGAGFDPDGAHHGRGLANLTYRVAAVGGTLEIDTSPGRGTRVIGTLPSRPPSHEPEHAD